MNINYDKAFLGKLKSNYFNAKALYKCIKEQAEDIERKLADDPEKYKDEPSSYDYKISETAQPIPTGIRTEIRHIMQKAYFVIPDIAEAVKGFERVSEIKRDLEKGDYIVDHNYVEAKALATVAYIILKEVI